MSDVASARQGFPPVRSVGAGLGLPVWLLPRNRFLRLIYSLLALAIVRFAHQFTKYALGSFGFMGYNPFRIHRELADKFGNVIKVGSFAMVSGRRGMRDVLKTNRGKLLREPGWPRTFKELIGFSLFIREDGPEALRIRRTLVKALHGVQMREYAKTMAEKADLYLKGALQASTTAHGNIHIPFHRAVKAYTFDVASTLFLGAAQTSEDVAELSELFSALTAGFTSIPLNLGSFSTFGRACQARDVLHKRIDDLIRDRLQELATDCSALATVEQTPMSGILSPIGKVESPDPVRASPGTAFTPSGVSTPHAKIRVSKQQHNDAFTNLLLSVDEETGQKLSIDELKTQIILLLIAGHDSTSSFITAWVLQTAQRPDILVLLRRELKEMAFHRIMENPQENLSATRLPLLEASLKEVERMFPPAPGNFRQVGSEAIRVDGVVLDPGTTIFWNTVSTNYDPDTFDSPFEFRLERWLPVDSVHSSFVGRRLDTREPDAEFACVTFGAGTRNCAGKNFAWLNIKIFCVLMLTDYDWDLSCGNGHTRPMYAPNLSWSDGALVRLFARQYHVMETSFSPEVPVSSEAPATALQFSNNSPVRSLKETTSNS